MVIHKPIRSNFASEDGYANALVAWLRIQDNHAKRAVKQIDAANNFASGSNALRTERAETVQRKRDNELTLHDILQKSPALLKMYREGKLGLK